jgi:hypothetical protein
MQSNGNGFSHDAALYWQTASSADAGTVPAKDSPTVPRLVNAMLAARVESADMDLGGSDKVDWKG